MQKIVLILPTYNEKDNISTLIAAIEGVTDKLDNYQTTILVVDDSSPDNTGDIVKKLQKKYHNLELVTKQKAGLGAALLFGIEYALKKFNPDFIIQMDADWQHTPLLLPDIIKKIEAGFDFVIGSRYIKGGSIPGNWGIHRKIYSIIGNNIIRFGLGKFSPHDWTSGYRMYRAQIFKYVKSGLANFSGYTYQVAFLNRALEAGYKIGEVPLHFSDRVHGKSKIAPLDYIISVLLYVLDQSHFVKYLIIGAIGFLVQSLISKLLINLEWFAGVAVGVGAFLAICTNFLGNNYWTFSRQRIKGMQKMATKFIYFLLTSVIAVLIQVVVVSFGSWMLGEKYWFWYMVFALAFLVIPFNYLVYSKIIWKRD